MTLRARGLVNACGPWVKHFLDEQTQVKTPKRVRLIKGSHIIVPRLHDGDHAFILQNKDNRIVFVIPYERDFSLIGTTDIPVEASEHPVCTPEEIAYLCELASHYMAKPVRPEDVVWTYSGVRPLFDDGDDNPSAVTRDYHLEVDAPDGAAPIAVGVRRQDHDLSPARRACAGGSAQILSAHGRRLDRRQGRWPTASSPTPRPSSKPSTVSSTAPRKPSPDCRPISCGCWRAAMARPSTSCWKASAPWPISAAHFGGHLYEHEVRYLMREEWAVEPDDVLWRRSKEGLHMTADQRESFAQWMQSLRPNA